MRTATTTPKRRARCAEPALSAERREEIAALAAAVSDTYCPSGAVDPLRVAAAKGISVSFGDYGEAFDGMLEWKAGRFHIFCNLARLRRADSPRSRFTLAHELGHYYLDEHRGALASGRVPPHLSRCDFESSLRAEQEADHFAANLLLPEARFRRAAHGLGPGFGCVLKLVALFDTSLTATAVRYASLNLAPCAVIKWHWRGNQWQCFSSSMFRRLFRRSLSQPASLLPESATSQALAQQSPPACGYFRSGTLASVWFPRVRRGDPLDVVLTEEAVPLGGYGALTMLCPQPGCSVFGGARRDRRSVASG